MKQLILTRGVPGCGKSTWIKEEGLEPYTICPDTIRLMHCAPEMGVDGKLHISQKHDKRVWETVFSLLEHRMRAGCFTVIDATHIKLSAITAYKELCDKYGYKIYIKDFSDIPLSVCLYRNKQRPEFKQVPDTVIETMYEKMKDGQKDVSAYATSFFIKPVVLENKDIFIFGDIHGCYNPLEKFFAEHPFSGEDVYIFTGDYIDRGIQNKEVIELLLGHLEDENVILLEGNHERWLRHYAEGNLEAIKSKEFINHTLPQLASFNKTDLKKLCNRFESGYHFFIPQLHTAYTVTHGGIPMVLDLKQISDNQLISGVGTYGEGEQVDNNWSSFAKGCLGFTPYSIHGHRNINHQPMHNTAYTYNLCDEVEIGGNLRVFHITKDGKHKELLFKNDIYKKGFQVESVKHLNIKTDNLFLNKLNTSDLIVKKKLENDIVSYTFSKKAFYKKQWTDLTCQARGLFVHTPTEKIVARGYNKFFNLDERRETEEKNLEKTLSFPVTSSVKYNGYLGLLSYNPVTDDFFIASKSLNVGDYAGWFKDILSGNNDSKTNYLTDTLKQYIKNNNVTFVFEVIDPDNDPHIVEYSGKTVVLLDIVYNEYTFKKFSYGEMVEAVSKLGFSFMHYKQAKVYTNFSELSLGVLSNKDIYDDSWSGIEGAVVEDSKGFMFKVKFAYYSFWKEMRTFKDRVAKDREIKCRYPEEMWKPFYKFLLTKSKEYVLTTDIIKLRNEFEDSSYAA